MCHTQLSRYFDERSKYLSTIFFCCVPSSFLRVCWLFFSLCRCDSIVCFRMKWYSIVFRPIILIRTRACGWYFQAAFRFCVFVLYRIHVECVACQWIIIFVNCIIYGLVLVMQPFNEFIMGSIYLWFGLNHKIDSVETILVFYCRVLRFFIAYF